MIIIVIVNLIVLKSLKFFKYNFNVIIFIEERNVNSCDVKVIDNLILRVTLYLYDNYPLNHECNFTGILSRTYRLKRLSDTLQQRLNTNHLCVTYLK